MTHTIERNEAHAAAVKRLDAAMAECGLYCGHCYADVLEDGTRFEVREYGDPLEGRAYTIDNVTGAIEETDR